MNKKKIKILLPYLVNDVECKYKHRKSSPGVMSLDQAIGKWLVYKYDFKYIKPVLKDLKELPEKQIKMVLALTEGSYENPDQFKNEVLGNYEKDALSKEALKYFHKNKIDYMGLLDKKLAITFEEYWKIELSSYYDNIPLLLETLNSSKIKHIHYDILRPILKLEDESERFTIGDFGIGLKVGKYHSELVYGFLITIDYEEKPGKILYELTTDPKFETYGGKHCRTFNKMLTVPVNKNEELSKRKENFS